MLRASWRLAQGEARAVAALLPQRLGDACVELVGALSLAAALHVGWRSSA
ncbi:hypothetical protein [Quadrisphaera sp. DSM 44207]|nr:hypothetical protein [Quadrisphaera sp. DSM 44207]SDQ20723.1 hypothetical protein SAMN05428996_1082 [Quadrisphaera sp. DSM 44207]